ncbi:fibronectin type III domain-containing protein [Paenibacillus sp. RC67]|uniref:fibronectin type III domain-containing protein n=1 Tax=Paenibacillus sp. RC67 TaxID=3039392 RepID=UPI0024AD8D36|nr:fibronectin type III domain-containing protein [Paenibacillus sp. RC67]
MAEQNFVYYEDWTGAETVDVINTVPPAEVTGLTASKVQATVVQLSWVQSSSTNVTGYDIYNGASYLTTVANTVYEVTGLSPSTSYTFTVKSRSQDGLVSNGINLSVMTAALVYALSMNGVSDYIQVPTIQFDTVILDMIATPNSGTYSAYLDASKNIGQSTFGRDSAGRDFLQTAWKAVIVDGIDKTSLAGSSAIVPVNQRTQVQVVLKTAAKSVIVIFANQLGSIPMKGILYRVSFTYNGNVTALYDFSQRFDGTNVPDKSGNNNTAQLKGGTWISN